MKLETSRNVTKSKRSLHWCRSISKKYLCTFYYSISQKVITLSGRRFITVSGGFITLSGSYYSIGHFYYIIGQLLQYRAFITLSVGSALDASRKHIYTSHHSCFYTYQQSPSKHIQVSVPSDCLKPNWLCQVSSHPDILLNRIVMLYGMAH